jgi:hypothetical protein
MHMEISCVFSCSTCIILTFLWLSFHFARCNTIEWMGISCISTHLTKDESAQLSWTTWKWSKQHEPSTSSYSLELLERAITRGGNEFKMRLKQHKVMNIPIQTPIVVNSLCKERVVSTSGNSINPVVRAHQAAWLTFLDTALERRIICVLQILLSNLPCCTQHPKFRAHWETTHHYVPDKNVWPILITISRPYLTIAWES